MNSALRRSQGCLIAALLCLPFFLYWATKIQFGTAVVESWLPGDDAARASYRQFREEFGEDQFLLVSWPNCSVEDATLAAAAERLERMALERPELGIQNVQDSSRLLKHMTEGPGRLSLAEAQRRLAGFAMGIDGTGVISLQVSQTAIAERNELMQGVRRIASELARVEPQEVILAGEPFQVYVIDRASREAMQYYVVPSSLVALLVAWLCLRRVRWTLLVFVLAGIGQLIGLSLVSYFVGEISAVLVVLPTLVFMLTLSAAIHLTNYYWDCGGDGNRWAGVRALQLGARPCLLATLTTVFGFGSLAVSQLAPVWQFGSLAALGLVLSSAFLLGVFPAVSSIGRPKAAEGQDQAAARTVGDWRGVERVLSVGTERFAVAISVIGLSLLAFAIVGIQRLGTSTEFEDMFPEQSDSIRSLRWVQQHLGPISSLEFLVRFSQIEGEEAEGGRLVRLELVERLHRKLAESTQVHSVMSATSFLPALPTGRGARETIRRAVWRRKLESFRGQFAEEGLLAEQAGHENWRITTRILELRGENYPEVRDTLMGIAESELASYKREHPDVRVSLELTGLRTVVEKANFALLSDLGGSFVAAFVLITPVMMLIVRGVFSGLILMIPNVLPVAFVFGCMGWLGIRLDVASILTASVALGIAVDDTLHFVSWFQRHRRQGHSRQESVRAAISVCSRPMFHTTLICTGAMLPFFFSDFLPTSKFALLMILILSAAILGDLILLPAILQSPLGKRVGSQPSSFKP